jgi:ABC-2 type transport system permease protein
MTVPAEEVQQAIGAGTMEAMLATRTSFGTIALGLSLQRVALVVIRSIVLLVTAAALGVRFTWQGLPLGAVILLLLVLAHLPFGLLALAGVLRFRQATPLAQGVLLVSSIFGGVYFPAAVIPGPLQQLASLVPLTYGLRAARRVLLLGASLGDVWRDVAIMAAFAVALGAVGLLALRGALRFSLRTGTIAQR